VPVGFQEVDEVDKQTKLISDEQVPLHIVVFKKGDDLSSQHIAGFGAVVKVPPRSSIMGSLLALLMSYYVFDLEDSITSRDGSLGVPGHCPGTTTDWSATQN